MVDLSGFVSSEQGQRALQQLQGQGFAGPQAQAMLTAAVPAAAQAMRGIARGDRTLPNFGDSNYVMNFTAAAVSGLIRGQGFMGSAMDGMQGMVGGYIAQVIAARFGLPKRTAGIIGAVITPMAIDFIWAKLEGSGGEARQQIAAAPEPPALPPAQQYVGQPTRGYGYATQAQLGAQGYARPAYQPGQGYYAQQRYQPAYANTVPQAPAGYAPAGHGSVGYAPAGHGAPPVQYTPGQGYRR